MARYRLISHFQGGGSYDFEANSDEEILKKVIAYFYDEAYDTGKLLENPDQWEVLNLNNCFKYRYDEKKGAFTQIE